MQNPLLAKLGYSPDSRLVLFHADDVGMCHGSNQAYLDLFEFGIVTCGSIMLPCPWAPEILAAARQNPALDLGVHLTLTSEWSGYRWGPLSTRDVSSGLIDDEGYFYHRTPEARAGMKVEAALLEFQTQATRAQQAGLDFTHFDTHMGIAFMPELVEGYLRLETHYQVPVLALRDVNLFTLLLGLDAHLLGDWVTRIEQMEASGHPIFDHILMTPGHHPQGPHADRSELYEAMLHDLPLGSLTFFSLHPNASGEIESIVPDRAYWRTFEHEYFRSNQLRQFLEQEQIVPIGFRELRRVMRET